jgi:hypothetical protein
MSDVCLVAGFALVLVGVYVLAGVGWTCLSGGVVLFVAGGLDAIGRRGRRR